MNEESVASAMAYLTTAAAQATTAPTAAQIQRFQAQLQQPLAATEVAHYDAPLPGAEPAQANFPKLFEVATRVSDGLRQKLEKADKMTVDPVEMPEVYALQETFREARAGELVSYQFRLIGKAVHMATRSVQTLYQQQG